MSEAEFNLGTVIDDAKKVVLDPVGFYKEMPRTGGFANPLIFVAVMAFVSGVLLALLGLIGLTKFNPMFGGHVSLAMIIVLPIGAVIGSFIGAAIIFVIWKLMGSEQNYQVAYRCLAYSAAILPVVSVLSVIPYIASIVRILWSFFLIYIASIHVHALKDSTAKIVFGVLAAIFVIVGINSERAARNFQKKWGNFGQNLERQLEKDYKEGSLGKALENLENVDEMTPEEAGEQFGEFLKGMQEFAEGMEKAAEEAEAEAEANKKE